MKPYSIAEFPVLIPFLDSSDEGVRLWVEIVDTVIADPEAPSIAYYGICFDEFYRINYASVLKQTARRIHGNRRIPDKRCAAEDITQDLFCAVAHIWQDFNRRELMQSQAAYMATIMGSAFTASVPFYMNVSKGTDEEAEETANAASQGFIDRSVSRFCDASLIGSFFSGMEDGFTVVENFDIDFIGESEVDGLFDSYSKNPYLTLRMETNLFLVCSAIDALHTHNKRQWEVLTLRQSGLKTEEIAERLSISEVAVHKRYQRGVEFASNYINSKKS